MSRVHDGPEPSDSPSLKEYKEQCESSVNRRLANYCMLLKAHKIDEVHVIYGAGEDDGGIEEIHYFRRKKGKLLKLDESGIPKRPTAWGGEEDQIESVMYDIMQARGFFNQNEGCQGVIRWSIKNDTLIHDHQVNSYGDEGEIANPDEPVFDQYRETTYVPGEVETFYGMDDIERKIGA